MSAAGSSVTLARLLTTRQNAKQYDRKVRVDEEKK
jgi:hypothetical protein